jgi:hypothetical protein
VKVLKAALKKWDNKRQKTGSRQKAGGGVRNAEKEIRAKNIRNFDEMIMFSRVVYFTVVKSASKRETSSPGYVAQRCS